ncbi:MAG: outer membrane protein [Gammaproteobacteria bacterium]
MNSLKMWRTSLMALCLTGASASVAAADLSYDFLELRYLDTEIDDINVDGDGLVFAGSYNVQGNWLIVGSFTALDFDGNVDGSTLTVGGGYVWPVDPRFDLFATASIVRSKVEAGDFDDSETGFALVGGIRSKFTDQLEGRAELTYVDINDSDVSILLGGDYYFTPQFAAGITLNLSGDDDTLTIGGRWFFGSRRVK